MIVVHGLVTATGQPAVWAESTPTQRPPRRTTRDATPHPFAVAPPVDGETSTVTLSLPSAGSAPLASPELPAGPPRRAAVRVRPWTVPVVLLAPGADPETLVEEMAGARAGASLGHLSDAVAFVVDLARRGRILPAVIVPGSEAGPAATSHDGPLGPQARWRPALWGVDLARFDDLRRAMPGAQRASRDWTAGQALRALLDHEVDRLARSRLHTPLLPAAAPGRSTQMAASGHGAGVAAHRTGLGAAGRGAVHAWLDALTGPRPTFTAEPAEVVALRDRLDAWQSSGAPAAVRTCFRLSYVQDREADDEPACWSLEFLLQPIADPSVLIPADRVWADRDPLLFAWVDYPQETLLGDLGRASRLYPDLDDVLHEQHPVELFLDTAGAYRFLTHAPLLSEAGFGVLLPSSWQRRTDLGLTLTVHSRETTAAVLRDQTANMDAIVDYRWGLALGAEYLTEAELVELAGAKVPLVRLRGRWVYLDADRLAAGLAFLARGGSGQMTAGEAMRLVRLMPEQAQPLPVTGVDGSGWLADLLAGRTGEQLALLDPPASLAATLRPYQRKGLSWLAFLDGLGVGALLADDMGLGKTVQLLALEVLRRERGPCPPTLIVCPLSVLGNWQREIQRFAPALSVHVHHGVDRELPQGADLVLTTYSLAARDVELLSQTTWDRVVLDEAQHVKNAASATARAVRRLPARQRVALTGTPVENRLTDLWSIMDFLNPGLLGPASVFRARYSVPVERYADDDAAARLRRVTRPFLLRRLKSDAAIISDLPEKFERTQWCNLTVEQATLYRAVVDEMFVRLREGHAGPQRKGLVLAAMTKLKQVCNHPAHLLGDGSPVPGRSGKIDRLEEILANAVADGDRALVFTQFVRLGTMLVAHLADHLGVDVAFLHGGTAKGARDAMVERFQTGTGPAVLVLSLKAGGTGLNLTAANHVVHVDRWWNPATEAQATDRAFRIGQRRDVQVHRFVCIGTIEERIDRMIAEKRTVAQMAVGSGEGWLTGLSTEDLMELVRLSPEAVGD